MFLAAHTSFIVCCAQWAHITGKKENLLSAKSGNYASLSHVSAIRPSQ